MRFFITLSYDGTRYHGWQVQPNGSSVQEKLQWALSTILRQDIQVTGAGAHFDVETMDLELQDLTYKLNRLLPQDIAIQKMEPVDDEMHARFSATSRTYHYYINTVKDPFLRAYSCELHYPLDFQLMNKAAAILMTYEDFGAFCKAHADVKTTLCHITSAQWHQTSPSTWYFEITANRFLRNMVRAVVEGKRRTEAGESMPANALFLEDVKYE